MLVSFRKHASKIKTWIILWGRYENLINSIGALLYGPWDANGYNWSIDLSIYLSVKFDTPYQIRRFNRAIQRYGDTAILLRTTRFSKFAPSIHDRYLSRPIRPVSYFWGGKEWVSKSNRQTKKSATLNMKLFLLIFFLV